MTSSVLPTSRQAYQSVTPSFPTHSAVAGRRDAETSHLGFFTLYISARFPLRVLEAEKEKQTSSFWGTSDDLRATDCTSSATLGLATRHGQRKRVWAGAALISKYVDRVGGRVLDLVRHYLASRHYSIVSSFFISTFLAVAWEGPLL